MSTFFQLFTSIVCKKVHKKQPWSNNKTLKPFSNKRLRIRRFSYLQNNKTLKPQISA